MICYYHNVMNKGNPMEAKPGDIIPIKLDGVEYQTYIDERGVQRFYENPDNAILRSMPLVKVADGHGGWLTVLDSNLMSIEYQRGKFTQREYAEAKMAQGYSVSGFCDLGFDSMLLENPLWDSEEDNEWSNHTNNYLLSNLKNGKFTILEVLTILSNRDNITADEAERHFVDEFIL